MLDGLLGRGFGAKCKSLIKLTKSRIDVIRRKRNATQKFLKKDIADLLANGLDINAFGRAEGLTVEVILSSCYDFVERCCDLVLKHLSVMQKQRECPEECKEAVASLMVAAARFSDLPELRDIRQLFQERYANSVDYCVDQKFVENIASKPPTLEKKVQLMKDIALEFSIKWDSKAFEQRMSKPPALIQEKPKTYGSFPVTDDKSKVSNGKGAVPKGDRYDHPPTERRVDPNGGLKLQNHKDVIAALKKDELDDQTRHRPSGKEYKSLEGREGSLKEKEGHAILFQGRQEVAHKYEARVDAPPKPVRLGSSSRGKGPERHYEAENSVPKRDVPDTAHVKSKVAGPPVKHDGKEYFAGKEEGTPELKPFSHYGLPPPYVKSNVRAKDRKHEANLGHDSPQGAISTDPAAYKRAFADNVLERVHLGRDHERRATAKVDSYDNEKDHIHQDDIAAHNLPKPRSSRRRPSRSRSSVNDAGNGEETVVPMSKPRSRSSRRRDESRRGLQLLFDDDHHHHRKDDEERRIDELLLHYSKKPSTPEPGQSRRKSKSRHGSRDDHAEKESEPTHVRSNSLPHEHSGPSETPKVFARASSFQPDGSNPAKHVHPKLPDYEDLAAKFAALRGR